MRTVYVYSAVPPNSKGTIEEYGLLSGVEVAKNKEILKLARPTKKSREDFVKKVEATAASDRPYPVLGPSVLFTLPDESKITDKHFIKEWGLIPVRINLSKLMEDYPETIIWGAELLPYKGKWRKLSDEAFDRKIEQEYGLTWEEFLEARSHELTLANVRKYSKMQPKDLWSNYERQYVGKYYAANVPHAFIITPMGNIPYAYVEFMNPRENPLDEYTQTLYHCSPTVIDKIDPNSPFGEFMGTLFFASGFPYSPGLCDYVYKLTMTYDQIIHIRNLEPTDDELQEIIHMVDAYCGFDKLNADQAYKLLTEVYSEDLFVAYMGGDECVLSDFTWWLQGQQARVARRMGYFGAESEDENGYVVMADMVGREHLLNDYMSVENEGYDEWLYRENPSNNVTFRKIKNKLQPPLDCSEIEELRGEHFHNRLILNYEDTDFSGCVLLHCYPSGIPNAIEVNSAQSEKDVTLKGANLKGANLEGANLSGADLQWVNLRGAYLQWVTLRGANLSGANLQGANLRWADLKGARLQGANLQRAYLQRANLQGADLNDADLAGADLAGADLEGAKYNSETNFEDSNITQDQLDSMTFVEDED